MASSRVNLNMGRASISTPEGNTENTESNAQGQHLYTQDTQAFLWQFVQQAAQQAKGKGELKGRGKVLWGSFMLEENGPDHVLVRTLSCSHEVPEQCSICMPSHGQPSMINIEAQPQRMGYADWAFPTKGEGKGKGKPGFTYTRGTNSSRSRSR